MEAKSLDMETSNNMKLVKEFKKLRMKTETALDLVFVTCCVCGSDDAKLVGIGEDFEYHSCPDKFIAVHCKSCGLVYLNPRPSISEFGKIYPPTYHAFDFSKKNFGLAYKVRSRLEARRFMRRCRNLPDNAGILDVGCGDGFHLSLFRQFGKKSWMLEGIDIDKRAVEAANHSGFKVHLGSVEEIDLPGDSYDLVFMIQTIEHVEKPGEVLRAIYRLLRKGGRLVIVTDNTDSIDFKLFKGRYWGGYHFPRHWNLFNRHSISKLGEKTGFETEHLRTIVSPVNWVYSIHNILVGKKKPNWLINSFTLKSAVSLSAFTALDFVLQKLGKGALLEVTFRKPL
jgi:2-polyprenyl-3-methyl-5-hydroxy-6-metoxy-1,4-benzoquinol methylase